MLGQRIHGSNDAGPNAKGTASDGFASGVAFTPTDVRAFLAMCQGIDPFETDNTFQPIDTSLLEANLSLVNADALSAFQQEFLSL